jgi:hypothetical protein
LSLVFIDSTSSSTEGLAVVIGRLSTAQPRRALPADHWVCQRNPVDLVTTSASGLEGARRHGRPAWRLEPKAFVWYSTFNYLISYV